MILAVGEALMEFRRDTADGLVATPGTWAGPFPSGAPAIFASVAARLGAPAALGACVGADALGRALVERMGRDGVRGDAIVIAPARATAVALVAYRADGTRDFWFSVHDSAAMEIDIGAVELLADSADWLHVSGSTLGFGGRLAQAVDAAATRVLERGGRLSLDPNVRADADAGLRERMARLARAAHVLFPSEGELAALDLTVDDLAGAVICETRGRGGALVIDGPAGADPVSVRAAAVDEVDSTGAGDTFAAAFVTAFRDGADALSAAAFGCEIASRSVSVLGAMEAPVEPRRGAGEGEW